MSSTDPFTGMEGLQGSAQLASRMTVIAEVQVPIRTLATFDPRHPISEFVLEKNLKTFQGVVDIMQDPRKQRAEAALNALTELKNQDPVSRLGFQRLDEFFNAVSDDVDDNQAIPDGFKADINRLREECRTQNEKFWELQMFVTFRYPSTSDRQIMDQLRNGPYVFQNLVEDFIGSNPTQHEKARKLLDKASALASDGKQAESLQMLSKALSIVVDHTPPSRKMHAFYEVRNLRNRLEANYGCEQALQRLHRFERPANRVKGEMDAFRQLVKSSVPPIGFLDRLMGKKPPLMTKNVYEDLLPKDFKKDSGDLLTHDYQDKTATPTDLPGYDHSRIPNTKYDAYSVPLLGIQRQAILCAHPRTGAEEKADETSVAGFYQMVADPNNNVSMILNVATASEGKASRRGQAIEYWPKEQGAVMVYGGVTMTCTAVDNTQSAQGQEGHSVYTLTISKEGQPPRTITMVHYENWPDRATATPDAFDSFMKTVIQQLPQDGTILSHCMAGKGRSGTTLAALEAGVQIAQHQGSLSELPLNIEASVARKRMHRVDAVQQLEQLVSIHGYVNRAVDAKLPEPAGSSEQQRALLGRRGPPSPFDLGALREIQRLGIADRLIKNRITVNDYKSFKRAFPDLDLSEQQNRDMLVGMYRKDLNSHTSYASIVRSLSRANPDAAALVQEIFGADYEAAKFIIPLWLGKWQCSHEELVDRLQFMKDNKIVFAKFSAVSDRPYRALVSEFEAMGTRQNFERAIKDLNPFNYADYAAQLCQGREYIAPHLERFGDAGVREAFLRAMKDRPGMGVKVVARRIDFLFGKIPQGETFLGFLEKLIAYEGDVSEACQARDALKKDPSLLPAAQAEALVQGGFVDDEERWRNLRKAVLS